MAFLVGSLIDNVVCFKWSDVKQKRAAAPIFWLGLITASIKPKVYRMNYKYTFIYIIISK
jgi:hypothetical protein